MLGDKFEIDFEELKARLEFLKLWNSQEDSGDDMELYQEEPYVEETVSAKPFRIGNVIAAVVILAAVIIGAFVYYNSHHTFTDYVIKSSIDNLDIHSTNYLMNGNRIIKYSQDGIFCVNTDNDVKWTVAYNMQTPMADVCDGTIAIAEQQGNQIYITDRDGLLGKFETVLPIMKARVSKQGITALVLKDDDITWIELYDKNGAEIVRMKTTIQDSGYPLDLAITPDASHMIVSYLNIRKGSVSTTIKAYDFTSADDSDESHLVDEREYPDTVIPDVYYINDDIPVAVSDNGYMVYKGSTNLDLKDSRSFETSIASVFYDKERIGFLFDSDLPDYRYEMEIYGYGGSKILHKNVDCEYTQARMENGEIFLYDEKNCSVYTDSGALRFSSDYEKEVRFFAKIPGFRRYLIITRDSMDQIRIS